MTPPPGGMGKAPLYPWRTAIDGRTMIDPLTGRVRKLRRAFCDPGHAHELTFSCYQRLPLLGKDRTRTWLHDSLARARERWEFELWAYVIMPEHVHVLLFPRLDVCDVGDILKSIKQPVARRAPEWLRANDPRWLERLKVCRPGGRTEYRFWQQGGGYDRNIVNPKVAWASVDYLHDNPVRRGLVSRAIDWQWSSARCYAGLDGVLLRVDDRPPDPA